MTDQTAVIEGLLLCHKSEILQKHDLCQQQHSIPLHLCSNGKEGAHLCCHISGHPLYYFLPLNSDDKVNRFF